MAKQGDRESTEKERSAPRDGSCEDGSRCVGVDLNPSWAVMKTRIAAARLVMWRRVGDSDGVEDDARDLGRGERWRRRG